MKPFYPILISCLTLSSSLFAGNSANKKITLSPTEEYEKNLCQEEIKIQSLTYASLINASKLDNSSQRTAALSQNVKEQVSFLNTVNSLNLKSDLDGLKNKLEELKNPKISPMKVSAELTLLIAKILGPQAPIFRHHTCLESDAPVALTHSNEWIHVVEIPHKNKTIQDLADEENEPKKVEQRELARATRENSLETQQSMTNAVSSSTAHCSIESFKQRKRRQDAPSEEASVGSSLWIQNLVVIASASPVPSLKVYAITRDNRFLVDELITVSSLDLLDISRKTQGTTVNESITLGAILSGANNFVLAKKMKLWLRQQVNATNESCGKYMN